MKNDGHGQPIRDSVPWKSGCTKNPRWLKNVFLFNTEISAKQLKKTTLYVVLSRWWGVVRRLRAKVSPWLSSWAPTTGEFQGCITNYGQLTSNHFEQAFTFTLQVRPKRKREVQRRLLASFLCLCYGGECKVCLKDPISLVFVF